MSFESVCAVVAIGAHIKVKNRQVLTIVGFMVPPSTKRSVVVQAGVAFSSMIGSFGSGNSGGSS
jgi:hypothetical protein